MLVSEVMTVAVSSIGPGALVDEAVRALSVRRVTSLPVVVDGDVVGIVSEADLLRHLLASDPRAHLRAVGGRPSGALRVQDVMTADPYTAHGGQDVRDLAAVMAEHGWKSVPVVDGARLTGMVSRSDVLRALARTDEEVTAELLEVLAEVGQPGWTASVHDGVARVAGPRTTAEQAVATAVALVVRGVRDVQVGDPVATDEPH